VRENRIEVENKNHKKIVFIFIKNITFLRLRGQHKNIENKKAFTNYKIKSIKQSTIEFLFKCKMHLL